MSSFIKDRNNRLDYRKKLNLKSICIVKIPENVTFEEVKQVCATYGQIHTVHETVKNCTYKFINFEFLENEDEAINALNEIGVECKKGQRKQESYVSRKPHLLTAEDSNIFDEVARDFEQKYIDSNESWDDDNNSSSMNGTDKERESSPSASFQMKSPEDKQDLPEKRIIPSVSEKSLTSLKSPCVCCLSDADLVCFRCGDFYCSKECQKNDWPSHRYICFPIPELVPPAARSNQSKTSLTTVQNAQTILSLTDLQKPDQPTSFNKFQITSKPVLETSKKVIATLKPETEIEVYSNTPAAGDLVNIVSVFNARHVYIRSLEPAADKEFRINLANINKLCKSAPQITSLPAPKSYACTDYQGDGLFYRVRVVRAEDLNNITVRYVDFGNVEKKTFEELRQLPEACKNFKIFKIAVTLNEIPGTLDGNTKMLNYLQRISDDVFNKYKIFYENDRAVLIDALSGESLNRQLLQLINVKQPNIKEKEELSSGRGSGSDSSSNESLDTVKGTQKRRVSKRVLEPPFTFNYLPVGENIPVIIVDNSLLEHGCFSCCLKDDAGATAIISEKAQLYADKDPNPYTPIEKEFVLVRMSDDNQWYRAQVSETVEDNKESFEVTIIDYGNVTNVKPEDIRHYPDTFTDPCKTTTCLISDLPYEIDEEILKELQKEIEFPSMKTIKKVLNVTDEGYASVIMGLSI